jgi:hypothetical protein
MARFKPEMARRPAPLILLRREDYRRVELCNQLGEYVYVVTPTDNRSEFDKGYHAGLMEAYNQVDMWCKARLDRLDPGKQKAVRSEVDEARAKILHLLRYHLPAQHFPQAWK